MLAKKEIFTPKTLAEKALAMANNDTLEATKILEKWCRKDVATWKLCTERLLRTACYDLCRSVTRTERRQIYLTPGYKEGGNGERVELHGKTLYDWPLPGGLRLGDATYSDLVKASDFYQSQADQMKSIATWLSRIAEKVGRGKVKNKIDLAELDELRNL